MTTFKDSNGKVWSGKELQDALTKVANDWRENAHARRKQDTYASHISEEQKDLYLQKSLSYADEIESGSLRIGFTIWQRINEVLTGDCVAFLPK